jgi:hypothetical protein
MEAQNILDSSRNPEKKFNAGDIIIPNFNLCYSTILATTDATGIKINMSFNQ